MHLLVALFLLLIAFDAQSKDADEFERAVNIRSTFILHILNYSRWDKNPDAFTLCVLESSPFDYMNMLQSDEFANATFIELKLLKVDKVDQATDSQCDFLFVAKNREHPDVYAKLADTNKLMITIGESLEFVENGGLVSLIEEHNKIKIYINREQYDVAPAKLSARLLKFANFIR